MKEDNMARDQAVFELFAAELPARELLSLVSGNVAGPTHTVVASNVLADNTVTVAESTQYAPFTQGVSSFTWDPR
jgi:hypothetical protein